MIKRLAASVREFKKDAILTSVTVSCEVFLEVIIPFFMSFLIDEGIKAGNNQNIYKYGLMLVVFALLALFFGALAGNHAAKASAGFARNLRHDIFYRAQTFSFSNIDKFSTGGIITRLTTDVTNIQNAFQMLIRVAVRAPLMLLFSLLF